MTNAELYTLIQSDPDAKHRAEIGDDSGCAERCSVIAPKIRNPVEAAALRKLLMKRGRWSELRRIANNIESTDPPFSQAMSLVDTIQANVPVDLSDPDLIAGGLVLVEHNLLSSEDITAISGLANTPQVISPAQVSEAMRPYREGAVNANG